MSEALTGTLIPRVLLRALHWLGPTKEGTAVCMDCGGPHRVPIRRDSTDAAATAILEVPLRGRKGVPSVWAWLDSIPIPSRASSLDLSESNCEAHAIFNPWWDNLSNTCHVLPKKNQKKSPLPRCETPPGSDRAGRVRGRRRRLVVELVGGSEPALRLPSAGRCRGGR